MNAGLVSHTQVHVQDNVSDKLNRIMADAVDRSCATVDVPFQSEVSQFPRSITEGPAPESSPVLSLLMSWLVSREV